LPAFFSEDLLDDVRSANSIYDVVSEYLSLKKSGRNFKGLCPFHAEKTPSFMVNPEKQIFHCFGCGEGGNIFSFVMKQQNMAFPEAVRYLAKKGGVSIPENIPPAQREKTQEKERLREAMEAAVDYYRKNLAGGQGRRAMDYLRDRQIDQKTIDSFSLGYALPAWDGLLRRLGRERFKEEELIKAGLAVPRSGGGAIDRFRGRVLFPITDAQGNPVAFGGRIIGEGEPKYLNSSETPLYHKSKVLYAFSQAREHLRKEGFGVVVEGYFDCLTAHQYGIGNVVATSGTALTEGHLRLMQRYADRWTVVFDGDAAGIRAAKRSLELFVAQGLFARAVLLPEGEDPDSFIREKGPDAFRRLLDEAESLMDFFIRRTVEEHPVRTVEGKVAAVRELVPLLAKVKGKVEQDEYIGRAAHRLGVKEDVLWSEVRAMTSRERKGSPPTAKKNVSLRTRRSEEVGLVKAMLASEEVAARMKKEVSLADLEDDDCRAVAARIFSLLDEGAAKEIGARLQFAEDRLNRLVASWLVDGAHTPEEGVVLQEAKDCLTRIRRRRIDRESRILQDKISAAEKAGERDVLTKLLKIKQGLRLPAE
jgi:DNA primase